MTTASSLLPSFRQQNLLVELFVRYAGESFLLFHCTLLTLMVDATSAGLKHVKLQGIYLSITSHDHTLWTGMLFVRKGVYAPAVLRFRISFPSDYPLAPPVITFGSEVFHPLLAPLTAYTHAASTDHHTPSNDKEERLSPGDLSLRHGFPLWLRHGRDSLDISNTGPTSALASDLGSPIGILRDKSMEDHETSIVDVLRYMRACFEDDSLLDSIPFECAANPSAWYAWQSHRGKSTKNSAIKPQTASLASTETVRSSKPNASSDDTPQATQSRAKQPSEWNWEGVWAERVKKAVQYSLTEQVLYGSGTIRDEDIHFLHADESATENMRAHMQAQLATAMR